jgi:hypothetical protein
MNAFNIPTTRNNNQPCTIPINQYEKNVKLMKEEGGKNLEIYNEFKMQPYYKIIVSSLEDTNPHVFFFGKYMY